MCKIYVSLRQTARKTEASSRAEIMSVGVGWTLCLCGSRQRKKYGLGMFGNFEQRLFLGKGGTQGTWKPKEFPFLVSVGGIGEVY
jgi:hypothetical protein